MILAVTPGRYTGTTLRVITGATLRIFTSGSSERTPRPEGERVKQYFTIYGKPIPQARAIVTTKSGKPHGYYPTRCENWRKTIQWSVKGSQPRPVVLKGALSLKAIFYLPSAKSRPVSEKYPTSQREGDLKNYTTALEDALKNICFKNDAQIVQHNTLKVYLAPGTIGSPRVSMEIAELEH